MLVVGGALLSKWKCANTLRSGNGFKSNSSENSSSSIADPKAIVAKKKMNETIGRRRRAILAMKRDTWNPPCTHR